MKKPTNKTIALIVVAVLLCTTVLTLGLIKVKPDKHFFEGYKSFQVYNLGATVPFPSIEAEVKDELSSVRYSVLRSILEGQGGFGVSINKNDDDEPLYLTASDVLGMAATSERFLLHFVYDEIRTIKVDGIDYEYNRAFVSLPEGNGEITEVKIVPYVFEIVHNDSDWSESSDLYKVADLRLKMRTSKLYVTIQNAIESL